MGRRCKHHGGSGLASDQIPGQNQNNICLRPCHSLWYHHQAFRDDTRVVLYSLGPSNASETQSRAIARQLSIGSGGGNGTLRKERNRVQAIEMQSGFSANQEPDLPNRQRLIFD